MSKRVFRGQQQEITVYEEASTIDPDIWEATESMWRRPRHLQCGSPTPSQGCQGACAPK